MKTNKKAIAGMLVAMVLSLGVIQGVNVQKQGGDTDLQQVWTVACYSTEASLGHQLMGCVVSSGAAWAFGPWVGFGIAL